MSVFNTKKTIEANDKQIIESFMKLPKTVHFSFQNFFVLESLVWKHYYSKSVASIGSFCASIRYFSIAAGISTN